MTSVNGDTRGIGSKNKCKVVGVILLSGEELIINVDVKGKLYEVFNQVTAHLGLREAEYFGLAVLKDEEYQFLILDEKISKVAPKKWKTVPGEGFDCEGRPLLTLWFRVQFYVDQVVLLREKVTRHLYYLQLKENVLKYNHLYNEEKCFQIVGFALQADYGNFLIEKHTAGYFDPCQYFPAWIVEKRGVDYLSRNCPLVHQDMHNVTRTDAELRYVRECSTSPGAHNLHFYRARKKKTDTVCNTWLAICARGVEVYEDDAGFKNLISTFLWPDIGRLVFDKKKFEIRSGASAGGRRFAYYTEYDGTSKYLLHICRSTHMFQMAIQPKLMEIRHLEAEDKKRYRESYIYSDARDLHANGVPVQYRNNKSSGKSVATQRYSLISDVSSNTTSGIVSDKLAISFDEGEEHIKEIIIDSPPRQNSLHQQPPQSHNKLPLRSSYKMTPLPPGSCSPVLPPQSLELFRSLSGSGKGSSTSPHLAELSPASSNGSYRTKLQQTSLNLYSSVGHSYARPTPSPSPPGHPYSNPSPSSPQEREFPNMTRITNGKESLKGLQSVLLTNVERNVSGDSTTLGSSASARIAALSIENSPVTQPAHVMGGVQLPQYPNSSLTGAPSFSFSPASFSQPVPAVVVGGTGSLVFQEDTTPSPQSGPVMLPSMMALLGVPDTSSSPLHHLPSPQSPSLHMAEHLYTDRYNSCKYDGPEILPPPAAFADSPKIGEHCSTNLHYHSCPSQSSQSSGPLSVGSSYTQGGSIDSGHMLSDESSSVHHSAQSSEEDSGMKDSCSDSSTISKSTCGKHKNQLKLRAGNRNKAKHVSVKNQKEALHPDIENILGQSQAHSLPLITALCNDLMTGSTHSSTGSNDTSTLRSNASHPDSRRWSACGPMEMSLEVEPVTNTTGTMVTIGNSVRPFSWHCEHFDLEKTLNAMPQHRKGVQQHPSPRQPPDGHHSFPHDLYVASNGGNSVLWTQAVANSGSSVPNEGSLDSYSPRAQLIAQQLMIPSRLSSGGHNVTDNGSISHHKTLKENIGMA